MRIGDAVGQFRQGGMMPEDHKKNACCHEYQCNGKYRVDLADDLVDRQQRSQHIINEYDRRPERQVEALRGQLGQQPGRSRDEYGADQHHQQHRKAAHELFEVDSQVAADGFRQALPAVAQRDHACQKIVYGAGEDAAQHDP